MEEGAANMTGAVGLRRVPRNFVESFKINLPPLAEQKIIADRLDTLLAQVEATKARLERISTILKHFRQSVLAAAVSGRLTEDWRKYKKTSLRLWERTNVGLVANVSTGKTPKRSIESYWVDGTIPWVTSAVTGKPQVYDAEEFVTELAFKECGLKLFKSGTLLLAMYGEGKTRGQVTELCIDATCNQACAAISVNENLVSKEFMKLLLIAAYENTRKTAVGGAQPNLNLDKVRQIPLHLPSLEEQTEIVRRVEQLFAFADKMEAQVKAALEKVSQLTQSILAKAFRGELTAQWREEHPELISGENSAQALLERIAAERQALQSASRGTKEKRGTNEAGKITRRERAEGTTAD